jgi:DNA processing protein
MSLIAAEERTAWIALASVDGVGELTFLRLLEVFGSASAALAMIRDGSPTRVARRVRAATGWRVPADTIGGIIEAARDPGAPERRAAELGGWVLMPLDVGYPTRLRDLEPAPHVLFGIGDRAALEAPRSVAVVGTRRPTGAGRLLASQVATRLAECKAVVVSGLAIGIDGAAHAATVEAGGRTVAVIGSGLARPGPRAHVRLARAIVERGGSIVGELPPDARPSRGTFPRRNRIISGLSDATLVIEAPARSGALITARHALEQGRAVLAAPGRIGDSQAAGCLALLRDTPSRPLVGLDELVVDLGFDAHVETGGEGRLSARAALDLLGPIERAVAERLTVGVMSADGLIHATGLPAQVVAGALTLLEVRGWSHAIGSLHLPAGPLLRTGGEAGIASAMVASEST